MTPRERLVILRSIVETLPLTGECKIANDEEWGWDQYYLIDKDPTLRRGCGGTMCLAGWAGLHPDLQEDGLVTTLNDRFGENVKLRGNQPDFGFLGLFFGLTADEGHDLFGAQIIDHSGIPSAKSKYTEEDRAEVLAYIDERITRGDRGVE
jgi:hypothetical protein